MKYAWGRRERLRGETENCARDREIPARRQLFFGSYETKNMCSKCYHDHLLKLNQIIIQSMRHISTGSSADYDQDLNPGELKNKSTIQMVSGACTSELDTPGFQKRKRCKSCSKKIGVTGFMCTCGGFFYGRHRYPEEHSCVVDYKQMGRKILRKQNPLCRADKIYQRIYILSY